MIRIIYIGHSVMGLQGAIHLRETDNRHVVADRPTLREANEFVSEQPFGATFVFEEVE